MLFGGSELFLMAFVISNYAEKTNKWVQKSKSDISPCSGALKIAFKQRGMFKGL